MQEKKRIIYILKIYINNSLRKIFLNNVFKNYMSDYFLIMRIVLAISNILMRELIFYF